MSTEAAEADSAVQSGVASGYVAAAQPTAAAAPPAAPRHLSLVSRRFVIIVALGMAAGLFAFAIAVFLVPHLRARRKYAPATCTVQSAIPGCSLECRTANVTSPAFPPNTTATIALNGLGSAPCSNPVACGRDVFPCRFRVYPSTRSVSVRKEPGMLSLGFIVFTSLGGAVLCGLFVWLVASHCGAVGTHSGSTVRAVIFLAPGFELSEVTRVARWRWPNLDIRGLDFDSVAGERADQFFVTVRRVFGTPERAGKRGVIFAVKSNARSDRQVLSAVPVAWFRVAVLPPLDVCLTGIAVEAPEDAHGMAQGAAEAAEEGVTGPSMTSGVAEQGMTLGAGFQERNKLLEAETTYRELALLSSEEEGHFDFVYSDVGDMRNYNRIVSSAFGPVVGLRTSVLASAIRLRRSLDRFGSFFLNGILACSWHRDPGEGKRAEGTSSAESEQSTFGMRVSEQPVASSPGRRDPAGTLAADAGDRSSFQ